MLFRHFFTLNHKIILSLAIVFVAVALLIQLDNPDTLNAKPNRDLAAVSQPTFPQSPPASEPETQSYLIKKGDTLSDIFDSKGIPGSVLHQILEADVEYLSLETLQPGKRVTFKYDGHRVLEALVLRIDAARTITFSLQDDGAFVARKEESETHWHSAITRGAIKGSFYASAVKSGLSDAEVAEVAYLLKSKIDFRRDLRSGDTFTVVTGREMTHDSPTGRQRIEAVSLLRGLKAYNAFLFEDGNYYNETGESVLLAFLRWPTEKRFRISSPFSPDRLNPITGRRSPHNGVDLATPVGTPIVSTGDGVVSRIGNHPFAGRYVDISHSGTFETRYLHLSKVLVKRGQRIKRGQKIALTGNSGRSTGSHLHFEFHVNGQPVNPLTADIPTAAKVPDIELASFKAQVSKQLASMQPRISSDLILATGSPKSTRTTEENEGRHDIN
ncbi:peptidoglycan DD-metalloendopeptidase family protein [Marinobacter sp. BSs20148]|uniref:peptidoglycan DD-metalloendopeptidase family protein n=1 Tax=Marinobacter sp. BSs20148 TaxID=490759 RepID=UPI0002776820|nr:peptidoglycan DD-metalloendopeptidase family protein [Marinobacter sp. BSs20148]AFP30802.1 Membrane protein [Marinobacter sp. BSs20148]